MTYKGEYINRTCFQLIEKTLGINSNSAWFIHQMTTKNQDELHFSAYVLDKDNKVFFASSDLRHDAFEAALQKGTTYKMSQSLQQIYFGNPGSGKSYMIDKETAGQKVFRTTFHPDSDYSTFVGTYKPESEDSNIQYTFVPQTFTNAYIE